MAAAKLFSPCSCVISAYPLLMGRISLLSSWSLHSADADGFYRTTYKIGGRFSNTVFHALTVYAAEPRGEVRNDRHAEPLLFSLTDTPASSRSVGGFTECATRVGRLVLRGRGARHPCVTGHEPARSRGAHLCRTWCNGSIN